MTTLQARAMTTTELLDRRAELRAKLERLSVRAEWAYGNGLFNMADVLWRGCDAVQDELDVVVADLEREGAES